jgi:hypothetical protein
MLRAFALLACALLAAAPSHAEGARVARGALRGEGGGGLVFFVAAAGKADSVAVGAAHSFDPMRLAETGEVSFRAAGAAVPVAVSQRYYAKPGTAFQKPGSSPRADFVVFALEAAPEGVRLLAPATTPPETGERVEIIGLPGEAGAAEVALAGTVAKSAATVIEVALDAQVDLRGWGGAPVLRTDGRVIGLLQGARRGDRNTLAVVGPISGAVAAMGEPFESGIGRLFATLAPPRSAANSIALRPRGAEEVPLRDLPPAATTARLEAALGDAVPAPRAKTTLRVAIESPEPEAIFGEEAGAFLAGRALDESGAAGRFDVYLVLDTSSSALFPSGADVDGDGVVGMVGVAGSAINSDPDDSVLAAEAAAAASLVDGLDPKRTRVGVVTFSSADIIGLGRGLLPPRITPAALVREPLTSDYRRVKSALADLARTLPAGATYMAAGIDLATLELLGAPGAIGTAEPESAKVILFLTDGQPTLPFIGNPASNIGTVIHAAERAQRAGVRIHSFAIGPDALAGPIATIEMAEVTGGVFTPVPDPARLAELVEAMRFTGVDRIAVHNRSCGQDAHEVRLHADGSWEALVPLAVGKNRIEVRARSSRGEEATATILVHYAPNAPRAPLAAELVDKYNRLLQSRLLTLTAEQRERTRKELVLEIETERARAVERAERQRKELEIRVEPDPGPQ